MTLAQRLKPLHIRLIKTIAESGKLQIAAQDLAMSQPAASRILAEIETTVGAPLFIRHPKGMTPTPIGEAFIRHARVILSGLDNLEQEVDGLRSGQLGEVRVGSVVGPVAGYLVPAIREVKDKLPGIEITVEVEHSAPLVRGLEEGRFDFIIARLAPGNDARAFLMQPTRSEIISIIAREGHPMAGKQRISLKDLVDYEWVIQERDTPIRRDLDATFHRVCGATPANFINSSSLLVVLATLGRSDAIAPISETVAALLMRDYIGARITTLDVIEPVTMSPCFVIRNRSHLLSRSADIVLKAVVARLAAGPEGGGLMMVTDDGS